MRRFKVINEIGSTAKADLLVLDVGGRAYGRWLPRYNTERLFYDVVEVPDWLGDEIEKEVLTFGNAANKIAAHTTETQNGSRHVPARR